MTNGIPKERLAGLLAGVFLLSAMQSVLSFLVPLVIPIGTVADRLPGSVIPFLQALVCGVLGWAYLCSIWKPWLFTTTIVLQILACCHGLITIAIPFYTPIKTDLQSFHTSIFVTGVSELVTSIAVLYFALRLKKLVRTEQQGAAADNSLHSL